jgi:1-phosphatidylinositol-4-phosphate 5-kinase
MLKTIPKREFDVFKAALEKYYAMIKRNPNSLISKFYGLHSVVFDDDKGRRQ